MARPQLKSSPLNELCSALPSLPMRLQEVGRFVAANDYDATTRSMRELAAVAGADPASFTRLAKALGYSGWDGLRAALTEARRPAQPSPFSGRTRGRRQGPNSDVTLVGDKFEAEAAGLARISSGSVAKAAKALHVAQRIWIAGFRSCRSVAELLNYQLRLFRPDAAQLVGGSGPEGAQRLPAGVGVHALHEAVLQALRVARPGGRQLLVQPRHEESAQQGRGTEADAGEDRCQQYHQPERQPPAQGPRPEPVHRSRRVMARRP